MRPQVLSADRASAAELVNVGEHFCLFRRDNHALALVNKSAATMIASVIEDIDTTAFKPRDQGGETVSQFEQASPHAEALMSELRCAGFLETPDANLPRASAGIATRRAMRPELDAIYGLANGPAVRLVCEDKELSELLSAALKPLQTGDAHPHEIEIRVLKDEGTFGVWRDGTAIANGLDRVTARRISLQAMSMAMLPPQHVAALLHASSVSMNERAVILAGATGSGKTTLMMALVGAGAQYMADDLTLLHSDGKSASAFPLAASVKQGSWQVLEGQFPQLSTCAVHSVGERRVRYVDPVPEKTADPGPVPVSAIVFPTFDPQLREAKTERLSPEEALSLLFSSGSEIVGARRSVLPLTTLVNETPAWRLEFPDTGSGVKAVELLAGTQ